MRRLSSFLLRSKFSEALPNGWASDELKRTNSGEVTEGNTSKTSADTGGKLVDIFDVEEVVEIQDTAGHREAANVASVFGEDVDELEPEPDLEQERSPTDGGNTTLVESSATQMVDRTPSKVRGWRVHATTAKAVEGAAKEQEPEEAVPDPTPPSGPKRKYTKEEKQRRFLKELFRITSRHVKEGNLEDDDSIVSSAVGSVSSVPPPTVLERFLHWFSCAASFQSAAIMDTDNPCPCNKENQRTASSSQTGVVVSNIAMVNRHQNDDDSLEQALAGLPPQSPREVGHVDESATVTLPIASPVTVQEDASATTEIIDGVDVSGAVSVKYSVRHVASLPGTNGL